MGENNNFQVRLEEALKEKVVFIEKEELPALRREFQKFLESFRNLLDLLKRKSLIREDPYKYEQKISEVTIPPAGPFTESEKADQLSMRLSGLEIQLDFLVNYYHFSLNFLDPGRLKKLIGITKYVDWQNLSKNSKNPTTQLVAEVADRIKGGSDKFSSKILLDLQKQLSICTANILKKAGSIAELQKERYKLNVRRKLLPKLHFTPEISRNEDEVIRIFKRNFTAELGDTPFYRRLLLEIINEEFSPDGDARKTTVINKLRVEKKEEKKIQKTESYKSILLDALRLLAQSGRQYEDIIRKMKINTGILDNRKVSFGERLKQWLKNLVTKKDEKHIYIVDYFDLQTSATKTHRIDFNKFSEEILKRINLYYSFNNKMSTSYQRVEKMQEDGILGLISKQMEEVQENIKKFDALSTFFKSEIPRNERAKYKDIKLELNALKNLSIKVNQKRHDYIARKEEAEQLKKLGVLPENQAPPP